MSQDEVRWADDRVPSLRQSFPAEAGSVSRARVAVAGLAAGLGADRLAVADIGLAVTEAVTNAVVHAYAGWTDGAVVEIEAWAHEARLRVVIRDYGCGLLPDPSSESLGLGLALIAQLAEDVDVRGDPSAVGTEVDMVFQMAHSTSTLRRDATRPRFGSMGQCDQP